jgi:hypothetical protein
MTMPEVIFGVFVLICFATFVCVLAGVHLYVNLSPRGRGVREVGDRDLISVAIAEAAAKSSVRG